MLAIEDIQRPDVEVYARHSRPMHLSRHSQETGRWSLPLPKMAIRQGLAETYHCRYQIMGNSTDQGPRVCRPTRSGEDRGADCAIELHA
jgi:hypothetical protein